MTTIAQRLADPTAHWDEYIAGLPLFDRVLIAHRNPNNFNLIDRVVERCRMDVLQAVRSALIKADADVARILAALQVKP